MAETTYDLNDIARLSVSFTVSGVATDPTTVTGTVRKPDGTTTSYIAASGQIVKDSTGHYHLDVATDVAGWWDYKLVGTGVATDTGQGTFYVNADVTAASTNYVAIDELKSALALTGQTYADIDIARACAAASRAIDNACGRIFYSLSATTRYFTPNPWDPALDVIDFQSISALTVDTAGNSSFSTTWTQGTDFDVEPFNPKSGWPYERIRIRSQSGRTWPAYQRSVKAVGTFGWASIPDPVNQYALILASKLLKRTREAPFGVLAYGLDQPVGVRIARNDPDFEFMLGNYVKTNPGF